MPSDISNHRAHKPLKSSPLIHSSRSLCSSCSSSISNISNKSSISHPSSDYSFYFMKAMHERLQKFCSSALSFLFGMYHRTISDDEVDRFLPVYEIEIDIFENTLTKVDPSCEYSDMWMFYVYNKKLLGMMKEMKISQFSDSLHKYHNL